MTVGVFRKTVLATSLIGAGLASTTGAAFASDQEGLANADSVQTVVPTNACNNDVPVNVLGVQVPVQDVAGNLPILSGSEDGGSSSSVGKSCGTGVESANG